ncbi:hypothetical protein [Fibrobacter sp.]|uniref:hypothetical protein n=1 Tax=Fibrobacter sp. TaxID=35828 RepID=UPI00388E3423
MNIKLISLSAAIAVSAAFAQDEFAAQPAPAEQTAAPEAYAAPAPAPAPAPVVYSSSSVQMTMPFFSSSSAEQAQAGEKSRFDVLRGNAYNSVGNQAAASTIGGNMVSPHNMYGTKLVYLEPTLETGVVAFGTARTYFLGFDNNGDLGLLQAGIASNGFGIAVRAGLDKSWYTYDNGNTDDERSQVGEFDLIGLDLSTIVGGVDFTVNVAWETTDDENHQEIGSNESNESFWDLTAKATFTNTPSGKDVFWGFSVAFLRHNLTTETKAGKKRTATSANSRLQLVPEFDIGGKVLGNDKARVLLGLNTWVPVMMFDKVKDVSEDHIGVGVYTAPNILAELALGNCWTVFGGARHTWKAFSLETLTENDKYETTAMNIHTYGTTVSTGARFQYSNFALEASVSDNMYTNPLTGFNGGNMIANFGGFILF